MTTKQQPTKTVGAIAIAAEPPDRQGWFAEVWSMMTLWERTSFALVIASTILSLAVLVLLLA